MFGTLIKILPIQQVFHWSMIPSEYYRIYKRLGQMKYQAHHSLTQPSGTPQPHPAIRHTTASPSHQAHHSLTQPSGTPQPHPAIRHTTASPSHQAHQTLQAERVRAHLVKMKDIDMDIDEASDTGIPSSLRQLEKGRDQSTGTTHTHPHKHTHTHPHKHTHTHTHTHNHSHTHHTHKPDTHTTGHIHRLNHYPVKMTFSNSGKLTTKFSMPPNIN